MENSIITSVVPQYGHVYNCHLPVYIEAGDWLLELLGLLEELSDLDVLNLHCTGRGGDIEITMKIIGAIKRSAANINPIVDGEAASAHGIIAMSCGLIHLEPTGSIYIHPLQLVLGGTDRAIRNQLRSLETRVEDLFEEVFAVLLTKPEINQLSSDGEIYLNHGEFNERMAKGLKIEVESID